MFLLSAVAIMELNRKISDDPAAGTPSPEESDLTDQHLTPVSAEQLDDPELPPLRTESMPPRQRPGATRKFDELNLESDESDRSTELYKPPHDSDEPPRSDNVPPSP